MPNKERLSPCPWCGETERRKIIRPALNGRYYIDHMDAVYNLKSSLTWETEEEAAKAWNERVTP